VKAFGLSANQASYAGALGGGVIVKVSRYIGVEGVMDWAFQSPQYRFFRKRSTIAPVSGTALVLKGRDQDNLRSQPTWMGRTS
jgi:hypothetical protein